MKGNVPIGASVPEDTEAVRIVGEVVSENTVFAKAIYSISAILSEKSQVFVPAIYTPV